jgi:predicted ATPase
MKKYVLTGGPCCGKTTLLSELQRRGFSVLEETARQVIAENPNLTLEERQIIIFNQQLKKENCLELGKAYFLDRSLIDGIAYSLFYGNKLPKVFQDFDLRERYSRIFVLSQLPFEKDAIRVENEDEAKIIHKKIKEIYESLRYNTLEIPVMPVKQRAEFILSKIQ